MYIYIYIYMYTYIYIYTHMYTHTILNMFGSIGRTPDRRGRSLAPCVGPPPAWRKVIMCFATELLRVSEC